MNTEPDDSPSKKAKKVKLTPELVREQIAQQLNIRPGATIPVCARRLRASGLVEDGLYPPLGFNFVCKKHRRAGIDWKTVAELKELNLESPQYWHTASEWAEIRDAAWERKRERPLLLVWSPTRILALLFGLALIVAMAVSMPSRIAWVLIPLVAIYFLTARTR